jgi:hypothetical protein
MKLGVGTKLLGATTLILRILLVYLVNKALEIGGIAPEGTYLNTSSLLECIPCKLVIQETPTPRAKSHLFWKKRAGDS